MAHTFSDILIHAVFSTKERAPLISSELREPLFKYMGGIASNLDAIPLLINGPSDHCHALLVVPPKIAVSELIGKVKSNSAGWANETRADGRFHWQTGFSAFSVSHSNRDAVLEYIRNQEAHHHKMTFKEELIALLDKHEIQYDPRYIWD